MPIMEGNQNVQNHHPATRDPDSDAELEREIQRLRRMSTRERLAAHPAEDCRQAAGHMGHLHLKVGKAVEDAAGNHGGEAHE